MQTLSTQFVTRVGQYLDNEDPVSALASLVNIGPVVDLAVPATGAQTLLRLASTKGYLQVVEQLITMGAPLDDGGPNRSAPLTNACFAGHGDVAAALLDAGASPNPPLDATGASSVPSPLYWAAFKGQVDIIDRLVQHGARLDARWVKQGVDEGTPLHAAVKGGQASAVKALLRHGASLDEVNGAGQTPQALATDAVVAHVLLDHEQALLRAMLPSTPLPVGTFRARL